MQTTEDEGNLPMKSLKFKAMPGDRQVQSSTLMLVIYILVAFFHLQATAVRADFPVAEHLEVADQEAREGHIITSKNEGLVRSKTPYDKAMVGVVILFPTIAIHPKTETSRAIISGGENLVLVSRKNGDIKRGDFITSSEDAGVGQKATQTGFILGVANQDFPSEGNDGETGLIKVAVNIQFNVLEGSTVGLPFLEQIGQGFLNNLDNPTEFVRLSRYVIAALVAIITILIAFFSFARSVRNGIEAMGRNPLARKSIQAGMIINAFLTSVIALFGLAVAYLIVRFF